MGVEIDRVIAEALGTITLLCVSNSGVFGKKSGCDKKRCPAWVYGTCYQIRKSAPAYSTRDSVALKCLQGLPKKFGWHIQFNGKSYFISIWWKAPHEAEDDECISVWSKGDIDTLAAAFADAVVEEYDERCRHAKSAHMECVSCKKGLRIKPALAKVLKGVKP